MVQISISEARNNLNRLEDIFPEDHPVAIVMRNGRPAFAIVDYDYFESLLEKVGKFQLEMRNA